MIIPHIEENLSGKNRMDYNLEYPLTCPICNTPTQIVSTENSNRIIEVLYCRNAKCPGKKIKKFTHFVSKPALNIDGLSEQTLEKFIAKGWLNSLADIYNLHEYREEIVSMEGFGIKSFDNLINAIESSKNTTLANLLVAMNIDLIGKSGAKLIEEKFGGDVNALINAVDNNFDFTEIDGFGEIMSDTLKDWFNLDENRNEFIEISNILTLKKPKITSTENSKFLDKKIVITGTFSGFSRDELTEKLESQGAKVVGPVSSKTDYVFCGENPGSKLSKAEKLSIPVMYEKDFINDI
jgi:DNA ligase (NAD+)